MEQPKIPTLKDAQRPQVKIKGMGAGLTLFDRLKQFKKKDLAFILAGLGTLFMAPLAEHFMMAPDNGDSTLQKGWGGGSGSGSNLFGSGSSPYENGNNSIAQGGAIGGSGDIITPLNARDPSSLVMGPGGMNQPNAGSMTPPTPPPSAPPSSSEDYKDALKASASRGLNAAVKKAPLPIPKIAVGGSGLRGLGVAGGGSSASGGMAPLNSGNLGQAGTGGGGLNLVRSAPNFRGAAGPRGNAPQGLDGTKKAGQNAGDAFSRTGSALGGLNAAASEQIPTGGKGFDGGGQGGAGANDKAPGGSGAGGSKSVGESLAFIEAKERMMENMKLEFEKRKLKDPELLMYGIRNEVLKAGALKLGEGLTKMAMCKGLKMGCPPPDSELECTGGLKGMTTANLNMCEGKPEEQKNCWVPDGPAYRRLGVDGKSDGQSCSPNGRGGGRGGPGKTEGAVSGSGGLKSGDLAAVKGLGEVCKRANDEKNKNMDAGVKLWAEYLVNKSYHLASAHKALLGDDFPSDCGVYKPVSGEKSLKDLQAEALKLMSGVGASEDANALTAKIKTAAEAEKPTAVSTQVTEEKVAEARRVLGDISKYVTKPAPPKVRIPDLYNQEKTDNKAVAVGLEGQIDTVSKNVDTLVINLETVQKVLNEQMLELTGMVGIGGAGAAGVLNKVQQRNMELKEVAAKTAPMRGYENLDQAPRVADSVPKNVTPSEKVPTETAAEAALKPIETANTMVDDYKTKKALADDATQPAATKSDRDKDAETARTVANDAVKVAVAKVADARTKIIGWADKTKTILISQSSLIISAPAPK